jgi:hypothetical protein
MGTAAGPPAAIQAGSARRTKVTGNAAKAATEPIGLTFVSVVERIWY